MPAPTGAPTWRSIESPYREPYSRMNLLARDLWGQVVEAFATERGAAVADLWLGHSRPLEFTRGIFKLGVPNEVVREWVDHRYRESLESIFQQLTGSQVRIQLAVDPNLMRALPAPGAAGAPAAADAAQSAEPQFCVRPENRLANASLQRLLRDPGTGNPLFLYGAAGVGKSALVANQLFHYAREFGAERTTLSVHAESFSNDLVHAIRSGEVSSFRGRMLAADALVLEEVHRLRGKPKTQQECLSILRYYLDRKRPVVLTSRHPPNAIFLLDEALRSYFLSGILMKIADYAIPSRVAILKQRSERFQHRVPDETLERIAQRVPGAFDRQVRFLEKVAAYAALAGEPATVEFVATKFPELAGTGAREVDVKAVIDLVAKHFHVSPEDIASNRKVRTCVLARHLVVYLTTVVFNLKARRVMRHLGGLSPSTTAYARRKIELRRKEDAMFDAEVRRILDELSIGQRLLF